MASHGGDTVVVQVDPPSLGRDVGRYRGEGPVSPVELPILLRAPTIRGPHADLQERCEY